MLCAMSHVGNMNHPSAWIGLFQKFNGRLRQGPRPCLKPRGRRGFVLNLVNDFLWTYGSIEACRHVVVSDGYDLASNNPQSPGHEHQTGVSTWW